MQTLLFNSVTHMLPEAFPEVAVGHSGHPKLQLYRKEAHSG